MTDGLLFSELSRLLGCVCAALDSTLAGPVCRCSANPSPLIVADYCGDNACDGGNGQATVAVQRTYPLSDRFPVAAFETSPCDGFLVAAEFSITVLRCAPTGQVVAKKFYPPKAADLTDAAAIVLSDAEAIREAALCCFPTRPPGRCSQNVIWNGWTPEATEGGCMGGTTLITVEVGFCGCPPAEA